MKSLSLFVLLIMASTAFASNHSSNLCPDLTGRWQYSEYGGVTLTLEVKQQYVDNVVHYFVNDQEHIMDNKSRGTDSDATETDYSSRQDRCKKGRAEFRSNEIVGSAFASKAYRYRSETLSRNGDNLTYRSLFQTGQDPAPTGGFDPVYRAPQISSESHDYLCRLESTGS